MAPQYGAGAYPQQQLDEAMAPMAQPKPKPIIHPVHGVQVGFAA
jgi:hypothetical protein